MMSTLYNPFAPKDKLDQEAKKMISEATAGQRALFVSDAEVKEEGVSISDQIAALLAGYEEVQGSLDAVESVEALFPVAAEYEAQSAQYKELGWLTTEGGKEGIKDKEGRFYPMPTLAEVYEVLSEQLELLQYKANQGFTRFILAPIGLSYVDMYTKLGEEYQRHQADGLPLYRTDGEETEYTEEVQDTWFSDTMKKEEDVYYYPETLSEGVDPAKHGGKTKQELIASSRFPGWEIHVLPEDCTIPREGKQGEKAKEGRVPLPAGMFNSDYLDIMKGTKTREDEDEDGEYYTARDEADRFVFEGESGLIPEVWVSLAFQQLRKEQQLLNDYYENTDDSAAVLTGILTRSNSVPLSYFLAHSNDRQVVLVDNDPYNQDDNDGAVSSVKVC